MSDPVVNVNSNPNLVNSLETLDDFLSARDVSKNAVYISKVPQVCKDFPCLVGIDEAGRGPVLGPMVYGIAFCPINRADLLVKLGCADSKELTEPVREQIMVEMLNSHKALGWAVDVIAPRFISNNMQSRPKVSLNQISMDSAIALVKRAIADGANIEYIYVDTVGPPTKYQAYLKQIFPNCNVIVEKKADSLYPIVSAASICAKVTRDHALNVWKFKERIEVGKEGFGSGYPGDSKTKNFLTDFCDPVFGFPELVRFSWSTATNVLETDAYHMELPDDEAETQAKGTPITAFFKSASTSKFEMTPRKQHPFFRQRFLSSTRELS